MGTPYTSGSAREASGFMALPMPLFCMYTRGSSRLANQCPAAMPTALPSLAAITFRSPQLARAQEQKPLR